jgi:hypothetical protein
MEEVCPVKTREIKLRHTNLCTKVDESDYISFNLDSYNWRPTTGRKIVYAVASKGGQEILLHRLVMGLLDSPRSIYVDHRDRDGLNNSRTNLRITNSRGNQRNAKKHLYQNLTSPYKGVSWRGKRYKSKPWMVRIGLPGRAYKHLGYYSTEIEAAKAYNRAATELFGEFAYLNVIPS